MKSVVLIFLVLLLALGLHAQEGKPWQMDRLCGKLDHIVSTPDHKNPNTVSETRTALRDIPLTLFDRHGKEPCCSGAIAIATVRTGRGGHFEFKNEKAGNYWLSTNWNGKEYTLAINFQPEKNSTTLCYQQGVDLDEEGKAGWWMTVTVD